MQKKKTVAFYTLGCKLNFAETSTIARIFQSYDFQTVTFEDVADVYVINSCSVTSMADKKSRNAISRAKAKNANAIIIVTGCYAQLNKEIVEKLGVDYVIGTQKNNKFSVIIEEILENNKLQENTDINVSTDFFPAYSKGDRTRSFLKIQDGCNYFCSFCTIPFARGRCRSASITDVVSQVKQIAESGIKEIVLTGVNLGEFGKGTEQNLFSLLKEITKIDAIERFRIGSVEPNLLTDEIIDLVAENQKLMPHFHIPLQSGCDEMLKLMNRHYDSAFFAKKIDKIKRKIPDAFIGIDLIVGVNGETEEYFNKTIEFVNNLNITFVHEFQYSERPNTKALNFSPKISQQEKQRRAKQIIEISNKKFRTFYSENIGTTRKVLFEAAKKDNKIYGFTENYIKVSTKYDEHLVNQIVSVELTDFAENGRELSIIN